MSKHNIKTLTVKSLVLSKYQTIFWHPSHCTCSLTLSATFTGLQLEQLKRVCTDFKAGYLVKWQQIWAYNLIKSDCNQWNSYVTESFIFSLGMTVMHLVPDCVTPCDLVCTVYTEKPYTGGRQASDISWSLFLTPLEQGQSSSTKKRERKKERNTHQILISILKRYKQDGSIFLCWQLQKYQRFWLN